MDKKKIEILVTSILLLIFIFGLFSQILPKKTRKTPSVAVKKGISLDSQMSPKEKLAELEAEAGKIGWDRNPFTRSRVSGAIAALYLSGILWDEQNPSAIIGDAIVKEGDIVGKYKIIKINKDNVVVSGDGGEKILNIWESEE